MIQRRFQNQRKSIRLENYDYSSSGAYFITICIQTRDTNGFGHVTRDGIQLNDVGQMIQGVWHELPNRFEIELDTFIIMPDHVHGIIVLPHQNAINVVGQGDNINVVGQGDNINVVGQGDDKHRPYETPPTFRRGEPCVRPVISNDLVSREKRIPHGTEENSLGRIVQAFKSLTTNAFIRGVRELGWQPFEKRLWERNYWERIIQDDSELEKTRNYILENPLRWLELRGVL